MDDDIISPFDSSLVVELSEYIEQLLTERPDKRKKKVFDDWAKDVNKYITKCNMLAKTEIYEKIKL